jgi:PIN domain nuclease of toxin-antitoxin system
VKLLLDTHVIVWWVLGDRRLSRDQVRAIANCEKRGERAGLAAISAWELSLLCSAGRVQRKAEQLFSEIEELGWLEWLSLTPAVAMEATRLGASFHRDPADQLIVATARLHGLTLVTADERIRASGAVSVL